MIFYIKNFVMMYLKINQKNNNYIRDIRNYIKTNNINIQDTWSITNNGSKTIQKDQFYNFIMNGGIIDPNIQLNDNEINYIFDILSDEENILSLDDFENIIMNYEPTFFQGSNSIIQQESHRLISKSRRSNFNSSNPNNFDDDNKNVTGNFQQKNIQFDYQVDQPLENIPVSNSVIQNDVIIGNNVFFNACLNITCFSVKPLA